MSRAFLSILPLVRRAVARGLLRLNLAHTDQLLPPCVKLGLASRSARFFCEVRG